MIEVRLRPGVEKKIKAFFQWVYNLEIEDIKGSPKPGDLVKVLDSKKKFLGYGYINPNTKIMVRLLSFGEGEVPSKELIKDRIRSALEYRKRLHLKSNAFRLVHSEGDLLPGLIVDVYDGYAVMEVTTYGMWKLTDWVKEALVEVLQPKGIYLRVSDYAMNIEGFSAEERVLYGEVPERIKIWEEDLEFFVDVIKGQKTGFYLDQRRARRVIRDLVEPGDVDDIEWVEDNAFDFLRKLQKAGEKFDVVVIDPPSFARTKATVENAMRGYKELCIRGLQITKPGGYLAIYSCSFHIQREHLLSVILEACKDVKKQVRVVGESFQDLDHPWILQMPNTLYLKGIYLEVL
jgi:23S rRNA (cytosine1962-C5)-methyltransferase